jgi:hypothetical protein
MIDIGCETFQISADEIRSLLSGKYKRSPCPECHGEGRYWMDDNDNIYPKQKADGSLMSGTCEECNGVGFNIIIEED